MSGPVTRSMKRLMLEQAKQSISAETEAGETTAREVCQRPVKLGSHGQFTFKVQVFQFLSLPGEIRNIIYKQYLNLLEQMHNKTGDRYYLTHVFDAQPALTRVNKQIRAESLPLYYAETNFRLDVHIRDDYTADDMWMLTKLAYPSDQIYKSISVDDLYKAIEMFAPSHGKNTHAGLSHWRHIQNVNAEIEIIFVFFQARLEGKSAVLYAPGMYPKWYPKWLRHRCNLADITRLGARIDELTGPRNEILTMYHGEFAVEDRDRLIEIMLLFGRLFPEAAKATNIHLNLSVEERDYVQG